ncbi:hypothetical protein XELAEV_18039801mg [Xenopus laevis]|uniref:Uncharacterized protein n=1 Tax=Xenopus laevis TaxID=8355 RepID=A0A974C8G2_XENLA|nr:hypothetical protein XELAEV_18039801mg [Xenopus laevis]
MKWSRIADLVTVDTISPKEFAHCMKQYNFVSPSIAILLVIDLSIFTMFSYLYYSCTHYCKTYAPDPYKS